MSFKNKILAASIAATLSVSAFAENVQIQHEGIALNGDLQLAEDKTLADGVMLFTHGTLAHNKMEIIDYMQGLLVESGVSTLAINLGYGIDNRVSEMYDCSVPAKHTMQQALSEMDAWQSWLDEQGAGDRWVMGHSRGGNQTAQYAAKHQDKIKGQVLLAPATWDYEKTINGYEKKYGVSVKSIVAKAQELPPKEIIPDVSVVYCENSGASAESILSYYGNYPEYDTPTVLKGTDIPTLVIVGSVDNVVKDLVSKMESVDKDNVRLEVIDDAGHFFRDIMADDAVDLALEFIEENK